MDLPAVQLLCPEQEDHPLEDHTRDFIQLMCQMHYLDLSLGVFYITSLSLHFATFVEWVLVNNDSLFTICPMEDDVGTSTICEYDFEELKDIFEEDLMDFWRNYSQSPYISSVLSISSAPCIPNVSCFSSAPCMPAQTSSPTSSNTQFLSPTFTGVL